MSICLDTIPALDGQTDTIGKTISRSACIGWMLTRDKKRTNSAVYLIILKLKPVT